MHVTAVWHRWRTALLAGLVLGVVFGVVEGFSIFYSAFVVDLGLDRADASGMYAFYLLTSVLAAPPGARLVACFGPRRVIAAAFPVFAAAVAACALLSSLWQFYAIYVLVLAATTTLLVVASQVLISASYDRDRGKATGIAYACLGVGDFLLFTVLGFVVEQAGWRVGYLAGGALGLAGALVFLRASRGLGGPAPALPAEKPVEPRPRRPLGNPVLWLACTAALAASVTDFFTFQTVVPYLTSQGWGTSLSGFMLGLAGLSYAAGQLAGGAISDRWSRELVAVGSAALFLAGLVVLWLLPGPLLLTGAVVLLGLSVGCTIGCRVAAVGDLFAGPTLSAATGTVHIASAIGSAFATWFGGLSYSLTGHYGWSFAVAGGFACLWVVALVLAAPRRARRALPATPEPLAAG
ncbi:MFS transporter [Saccharopolyspora phatthalungensis]|uniref:MFS family permease n=1 Tax=Saccharopolyspora phatthalungensis TaxID=664693 RepID=A0A840Q5Q9_9PSEU|nr:MFS transporter [Saccharopolyspora phatthalungensis]MBB5157842.1 MFS family permease [Saccharopolyspora phatthalungensis]